MGSEGPAQTDDTSTRLRLSPSLLQSSPAGAMLLLRAVFQPQIVAGLYPAGRLGGTQDVFIGALPHYGSVWQTPAYIKLPLSANIYFSPAKHFLTPYSHTHTYAHTPFGCNKTADQSHWLLTGTDTETCCCWRVAWEMFITHQACRFGQERNNGLIKWRPGAAVGKIHTHTHTHRHLRASF